MSAELWPITGEFAAEIGDVDLSQPLDDGDWRLIEDAYNRYSVLVFPGQHLDHGDHAKFAARFGPVAKTIDVDWEDVELRLPPDISDVSNLGPGRPGHGARRPEAGHPERQPPVAYGQLVPDHARGCIAALHARHSAGRRLHGIRRHARRLGRAR